MKAAKENHTVGIESIAHTETWERGFQASTYDVFTLFFFFLCLLLSCSSASMSISSSSYRNVKMTMVCFLQVFSPAQGLS